jgi:hypothetical protein
MTTSALGHAISRMLALPTGEDATGGGVSVQLRLRGVALTRALVPLLGEQAVMALFSRALTLTSRHYAWTVPPDRLEGSEAFVARAAALVDQCPRADAPAAAAKFLETVSHLLMTFIGEAVTMRVLAEAWPGCGIAGDEE